VGVKNQKMGAERTQARRMKTYQSDSRKALFNGLSKFHFSFPKKPVQKPQQTPTFLHGKLNKKSKSLPAHLHYQIIINCARTQACAEGS